jgi:hypothetical protein
MGQFLRKTYMYPNRCFERLHPSRNYSKWCIIDGDPNFGDFRRPKFTSFFMEGFGRKYFGKLIFRAFKYRTCKGFRYLLIFIMFWKLIFARFCQMKFCDLRIMTFRNFCYGGIVLILLELKWFVLPAMIAYFLRYPVSAVNVTFLFRPEFQRLSR